MNPLSPQTRELLRKFDPPGVCHIPVADLPQVTISDRVASPPAKAPSPSLLDIPLVENVSHDETLISKPEMEVPFPAANDFTPGEKILPYITPLPSSGVPAAEEKSSPGATFSDDSPPPPSDDDFLIPINDAIDLDEMMLGISRPDDAGAMPPPKVLAQSPPGLPGSAPGKSFPPGLEIDRWYLMITDEHGRPVAILDQAKGKAAHSYPTPPERLNFKIDLGKLVAGASVLYRSPLPVHAMMEKFQGSRFCFGSQPGDNKIIMKVAPLESSENNHKKIEILAGKIFSGPSHASSFPVPAWPSAGQGGFSNSLSQMGAWLDGYRQQRRSIRY